MELNVDHLIDFFNKFIDKDKEEIGEQDAAPATGGGSTSSVPKWADTYTLNRGKANPLMKSGEKWTTGLTRGAANQIW